MLIGEVAERSGVSARMLRHYDRIGLLTPTQRTAGGYREYADADVHRLFQIEALRSLGLGLMEVAEALSGTTVTPEAVVDQLIARTRERLAAEQRLLQQLTRVRAGAPAEWTDVLDTVRLLNGIAAGDPSARQRFALTLTPSQGQRDATALAGAVLSESDVNTRGALSWALAQAGDAGIPPLSAALASDDPDRRRRAVEALEKIGTPAALTALADAVAHPDPAVRSRAALARGALGDAGAIDDLVALIVDGVDDVAAADALAALDAPDEVAQRLGAALSTGASAERQRLAAALADVHGALADSMLSALSTDADAAVARIARFLRASRSA